MNKASKDIFEAMKVLIRSHHPDLIEIEDKIFILMKEKASTKGGVTTIGTTKKAPALMAEGIETKDNKKWTYIITLGFDAWNMLSDRQKNAQLDHCLCAMEVTYDKEGYPRYSVKPPDFSAYHGEVARWGLWHASCDETAPTVVEKIFGKAEDDSDEDALQIADFE